MREELHSLACAVEVDPQRRRGVLRAALRFARMHGRVHSPLPLGSRMYNGLTWAPAFNAINKQSDSTAVMARCGLVPQPLSVARRCSVRVECVGGLSSVLGPQAGGGEGRKRWWAIVSQLVWRLHGELWWWFGTRVPAAPEETVVIGLAVFLGRSDGGCRSMSHDVRATMSMFDAITNGEMLHAGMQ